MRVWVRVWVRVRACVRVCVCVWVVASWCDSRDTFGCTLVGESDCKDQVNKVHPDKVMKYTGEEWVWPEVYALS